jgi:hypothetical protein
MLGREGSGGGRRTERLDVALIMKTKSNRRAAIKVLPSGSIVVLTDIVDSWWDTGLIVIHDMK